MKVSKLTLFISILFLGISLVPGSALPAPYTLVDEILFNGEDGYVSGIFSPGPLFLKLWHPSNNPTESFPDPKNIMSAALTLTTQDDLDDPSSSHEYWLVFSEKEWLNHGNWWVPVLDSSHPFVLDIEQIRENGGAEVTVMALWGDFYVSSSKLELTYQGDPTTTSPVPEPSTFLLFGSSMLGMAVFMRRKWTAGSSK